MFALSKKDTPHHWMGMYYAAWINLGISVLNLAIGNVIMAVISLCIAIASLYIIKRKTQEELWAKLVQTSSRSVWDDDGSNSQAGP